MGVPVFPPPGAARVLAAAALFLCGVLTGCRLATLNFQSSRQATSARIVIPAAGALLSFPPTIRRLHINVGPNYSPITPPGDDPAAGVLAVEAQLEVASVLRERFARAHADRFFVISAALAGEQHVGFRSLNMYNHKGQSSSLAVAKADRPWSADGKETRIGRGVEFVPVLSLGRLLHAIPADISIPLLKTDTQVRLVRHVTWGAVRQGELRPGGGVAWRG